METTLVLLKPSCVQRQLIGEIVNRFERRGLRISGMKMMQLDDQILREHYAHLADRPFFPTLADSMKASPVVALAISGIDAVQVVRTMTGSTNGREAAPGTIRGDYAHVSFGYADARNEGVANLIHASGNPEEAEQEVSYWFAPEEIQIYKTLAERFTR